MDESDQETFLLAYLCCFRSVGDSYRKRPTLAAKSGSLWLGQAIHLGCADYLFDIYYLCNGKENFVKSLKKMYSFLWFRQIGIDLSLGLIMFDFLIYLNTGSALAFLIWLVPLTLFGNLASLLYLAVNYDSILAHFL